MTLSSEQARCRDRTMKTTLRELRPLSVRTAAHTRAHVFIIMLAYLLVYQLAQLWHDVAVTLEDILGLRAYPNNPEALKAMRAQAKWRKAR